MDAMLAGQDLGLNVVNGYSGLIPKGYPPAMFFLTGDCCNDWAFRRECIRELLPPIPF